METVLFDEACPNIKIRFSPNSTLINHPSFVEGGTNYVVYNSPEPGDSLRVVYDEIPPNQNYSRWILHFSLAGTYQQVAYDESVGRDGYIATYPYGDRYTKFGNRKFNRTEVSQVDELYDDGGFRKFTQLDYIADVTYDDYDDDGNPVTFIQEVIVVRIETRSLQREYIILNDGGNFLNGEETQTPFGAVTSEGSGINLATGESTTGYRVRVFSASNPDDPVITYHFTSDPRVVSVECLDRLCREGCIPLFDANLKLRICLCDPKETGSDYDEFPNLDQDARTWTV